MPGAARIIHFPQRTEERIPSDLPSIEDVLLPNDQLDLDYLLTYCGTVKLSLWEEDGGYELTDPDGKVLWEIRRKAA